jgi:hypothetical protein
MALAPAVKAEGAGPKWAGPFPNSTREHRWCARRAAYGQSLSVAVNVILPFAGS